MAQSFAKTITPGEDGFELTPNFVYRIPLCEIAFPVDENGAVIFPLNGQLEDDVEEGFLGDIFLGFELEVENYTTPSSFIFEGNFLQIEEVFVEGVSSPCILDADGDGVVSAGDIDSLYIQNIGKGVGEVGVQYDNVTLAITMDFNNNGVIDEEDFEAAKEFVGEIGCAEPQDFSYPYYVEDGADQRLAFAYSLRKLRASYDGPCMTVFLDVDKRKLAPQSTGIKFWQEFGSMLAISGDDIKDESLIGDPEVDMYQQWLDFVDEYPWLANKIDIPFDDTGYVDYLIIHKMMKDPPEAFGVKDSMTDEEYNTFITEWNRNPSEYERTSWLLASVVLMDRWYDQRPDEQRDFIPRDDKLTQLTATKNEGNGGRTHPFSKSTIMVGMTDLDKETKTVVNHNGRFCLGSGCTYGLGQVPWTVGGTNSFNYPPFEGFTSDTNDGILYPGSPQSAGYGAPGLSLGDLKAGWWNWWQYDESDVSTRCRLGDMSMVAELTNGEYNNPWRQDNAPFIYDVEYVEQYDANPNSHAANSSGQRTVLGAYNISNGRNISGINFGGAVPGNQMGLVYGYTDRRDFDRTDSNGNPINRPISPGQTDVGVAQYTIAPNDSGETTDNVNSVGFSSHHLVQMKQFSYNRQHYVEFTPTFPSGTTYEGETAYNTFAGGQNANYFLGKQQDYFTVTAPSQLGNWFEFIGWRIAKDDEFLRSYINESKEYFTNKKIMI